MSSTDKAEDVAFYMDQGSARKGSIRGSGMVFAEKKRRQEERKETEMKKSMAQVAAPSGQVKPVQAWNTVLLLWISRTRRWRRMQMKMGLNRTKRGRHLMLWIPQHLWIHGT